MDALIRSKVDSEEKGRVFDSMNKEFLAKQEKKKAKREEDERAAARKEAESREQDEKAQAYEEAKERGADGVGKQGGRKKKSDKNKAGSVRSGAPVAPPSDFLSGPDANTVQGNMMATIEARAKTSKKIDYESLGRIFDETGDGFLPLGGTGRGKVDGSSSKGESEDESDDSDSGSEGSEGEELGKRRKERETNTILTSLSRSRRRRRHGPQGRSREEAVEEGAFPQGRPHRGLQGQGQGGAELQESSGEDAP